MDKIQLEEGMRYPRRDGEWTGALVSRGALANYPFYDHTNSISYTSDGKFFRSSSGGGHPADIIGPGRRPIPELKSVGYPVCVWG